MKFLNKRFTSFLSFSLCLILAIGTVSLFSTGCPSKSTIQKAITAAEQVDSMTQTAETAANFAVQDNLLTAEQYSVLSPKFAALSKGAKAFKNAAEEFKATYKGDAPPDKLAVLSVAFSASVVAPFLEVLQDLKLMKSATKVIAAVGIIRIAILQISAALEKKEVISELRKYDQEFERTDYNDTVAVTLFDKINPDRRKVAENYRNFRENFQHLRANYHAYS